MLRDCRSISGFECGRFWGNAEIFSLYAVAVRQPADSTSFRHHGARVAQLVEHQLPNPFSRSYSTECPCRAAVRIDRSGSGRFRTWNWYPAATETTSRSLDGSKWLRAPASPLGSLRTTTLRMRRVRPVSGRFAGATLCASENEPRGAEPPGS